MPSSPVGSRNSCHWEETGAQMCPGSCLETQWDLHPFAFWPKPLESPLEVSLSHWAFALCLPLAERDLMWGIF